MNRTHIFSLNEFYHLYNRGTDKRDIFLDKNDYHRFLLLIYLCNRQESVDLQKLFREGRSFTELFSIPREKPLVAIGAWTLMPNHFHLLIKELTEGGITTFMRKVNTGYSMYFNKKYDRSGSLFQGKFKSQHLDSDNYLKYIFSYIHLNAVKLINGENNWKEIGIKNINQAKDFLSKYEYSSFRDYINKDTLYNKIINEKEFPEYFLSPTSMWNEIMDWLNYKNEFVKLRPSQD